MLRGAAVAGFFSVFAYFVAPFTWGDRTVLVPPNVELDATLATLLVADRLDALTTRPASFYDTAILYPDRTQLRSTEPFLGFVLLAAPLRFVLQLNDVDVFEALRWLMIFTSLAYAYLLFRALGVDRALSLAGAVLCWSHGWLLYGIERLQVVSIPLFLPIVYHAVMVWRGSRPRLGHRVGLFVSTAMYPLLGAINATTAALAALLVLPWLLKQLVAAHRERRVVACVLPLVLAGVFDVFVLAPWLFDRADLRVYAAEAFLEIKHWNPTRLPSRVVNVAPYVHGMVGRGLGAALTVLAVLGIFRRLGPGSRQEKYFAPLVAVVGIIAAAFLFRAGDGVQGWLQVGFHAISWATLLFFWWQQLRSPAAGEHGVAHQAAMLSFGLSVFLCLMSFGPVYVSNTSVLANHVLGALLDVVPPLKLIREYYRLYVFGVLFLSVYVTVRLAVAFSRQPSFARTGAAALIVAATMTSVYSRQLVASAEIGAPADLVQVASHSRGKGGLYVHPDMFWNSKTGVLMIAVARQLGRPVVNGYLGIELPWFGYASNVLHRFPDPEALWLLHRWNIDSVVSLPGSSVSEQAGSLEQVYEDQGFVVWELTAAAGDLQHPSAPGAAATASEGDTRVEAEWSWEERDRPGTIAVKAPARFRTRAIEIHFAPSVVEPIPSEIAVFAPEDPGRQLNAGDSGKWIASLAADALLRRQSPVATITVQATDSDELILEFRNTHRSPIERIALLGEWGG